MTRPAKFSSFICAAVSLFFPAAALAQNPQSFVSATGSDANNCTFTAHCRSINRALAVTDRFGEVVIATSGAYASATISQPVTISAVGVDASIVTFSADSVGLNINATGDVTVNGLSIRGAEPGGVGINVQPSFSLHLVLENVRVQGYEEGLYFGNPNGVLSVYHSQFEFNGDDGLFIRGAGATAFVEESTFDGNDNAGILAAPGTVVTVSNSSSHANHSGFSSGGTIILSKSNAVSNLSGLETTEGGKIYLVNSVISNNEQAWDTQSGGAIITTSPATNFVAPGQIRDGSLSGDFGLE